MFIKLVVAIAVVAFVVVMASYDAINLECKNWDNSRNVNQKNDEERKERN